MTPSLKRYLGHFLAYQLVWFGCILLASQSQMTLACLWAVLISVCQLACDHKSIQWPYLRKGVLSAMLFAVIMDSLASFGQWYQLAGALQFGPITVVPFMIGLWFNFVVVAHLTLGWLRTRLLTLILLSAIGFPLAFWGGFNLGAGTALKGVWTYIWIGCIGAAGFPWVFRLCCAAPPVSDN